MKEYNYKKWFYINCVIIILSICLFISHNKWYKDRVEDAEWNSEVLQAEISQYKTKEGLNAAKIKAFEYSKAKDFINLKTKDSTILKLQQLVNTNKNKISKQGNITVINTESSAGITVATKPIESTTISNGEKYPVYEADFNLKGWIWGKTVATVDSIGIKINYREELSLVIGREKTGFLGLGRGTPYADVTLHNPYSSVKELRTYQTKLPKEKKFGIGPSAIYGLGQEFQSGWFVGIGINYNLIQF